MTLSIVRPNRTITIPKRVRDNMGLLPRDWVEFEADDYSTYVNRLVRDSMPGVRAVGEAVPKYDSDRYVVTVSSSAELILPQPLFDDLMLENGSVVGFFRDAVGYRFIPIYNPTKFGPQTGSANDDGIQILENSISEYSVAVSKEARREIAYDWQNVVRTGDNEPFRNVDEPASDDDILRELTKRDPAFSH